MKTELRKREDIPPLDNHRVENANDPAQWPDAELTSSLKGIFPPVTDIAGTIKSLRSKTLYLLAPGVAKKPLSHLPPLPPKPSAAVGASASTPGSNGSGVASKRSDPRVYTPTEQEEKELTRKIELSEKSPPRSFGSMPEKEEPVIAPVPKAPTPTAREIELAKSPGQTPEHRAARETVAKDFYINRTSLGPKRFADEINGVDLNQPVEVVSFPPPPAVQQYVRKGARGPGNFFDPIGGQSADSLGLNGNPSIRESKTFAVTKGQGLQSIAAPIDDSWTDPSSPMTTGGGGKQLVVDNATRDSFRVV